ncbi:MAG TPA: DUF4139 domain-containing protein [Steroidobacteraceae bacterium]|jgi:hypothetical protein|nr:DUF4139 domain-containing protein [Steroidobacteraceae bacterium]
MGLRLVLIGSLLGLLIEAPAMPADRTLSVTIYAGDLALVQDRRDVEIKGGRQRLEFQDVSAQIRPETVSLTAADISIVEQNFDFDLLTPAKLMEKAVGRQITIVRVNPATGAETREQAQVLATNGGVVLKIGERIEVLRDDGLPVRVIFDKVPENLRAHPTLSVTVVGSHAGVRPATLSYLTPGLGWRADYVALYNEGDSKIDVQGWVTLTNSSGVTYDNAQTLLVAGSPTQVDGGARPSNYYRNPQARATLQQAGTETGSRERLGDYYLYPLAERTTIANLQTKQVSFLDVHGVPAEHGYEYRNRWLGTTETPQSAKSVYGFSTSAHAGLGDQLPAGVLRFYMRDKRGEPQFIGENHIDHTPMGSTLSLATGDAFDVKVRAVVEKRTRLSSFNWQSDMRYELSNALPRPVTVKLLQEGLWGDSRITAESQKSARRSAETAEWAVTVPANGKTSLTASFETRF